MKFFSLLFAILIFVPTGQASQDEGLHILLTPYELEMQKKAKKRLYPGGIDDEPLKVQVQLPNPSRGHLAEVEEVEEQEHD